VVLTHFILPAGRRGNTVHTYIHTKGICMEKVLPSVRLQHGHRFILPVPQIISLPFLLSYVLSLYHGHRSAQIVYITAQRRRTSEALSLAHHSIHHIINQTPILNYRSTWSRFLSLMAPWSKCFAACAVLQSIRTLATCAPPA